jgi:outer membrane protein TolC
VAARQDVEVKLDSVNWAREQLARSERAIEAGALARVELSASEAELQRRLDTWYATMGAVTEAENTLKAMLAGDRAAPLWGEELIPVDERKAAAPQPIHDLPGSMEDALRSRPELRANEVQRQMNEIEKRATIDQVRPQVNLVASYGRLGLGGSLRPVLAGRYQAAQIGLAMDFTLRNNEGHSAVAQSAIAGRRLKLEKSQIEQAIEAQVRNALQSIETARQRIAAAQASERAAKEKLDSETRLFQTGDSTNFLVLTRQNEFTDSRRRAVVANLELNKAMTRFEQAVGATLREHQISLK